MLLSLLFAPAALAKSDEAVVSGRVVDLTDGSPIALASVVIETVETRETVSATLSAEGGRFRVPGLPPGEYWLYISSSGFEVAKSDLRISPLNRAYDLGSIPLRRLPTFGEEIKVTGETVRTVAIDSQLFRLDEGAAQSTGSLLDAMKNLPGVTVNQEGKVLLRGSDQITILIDGKQSSLTGFGSQRGLDSVSAANVESIEIIHNPAASMEAAGMAGVINIISRQEQQLGFSADAALNLAVGQLSKQRQDLPTEIGSYSNNEKAIVSLNLNHNNGKVRSFLHGEYLVQHDLPNNEFSTRFYDDGRVIESQVPENREQVHYIVRAGADWKIGDSNVFSLSGIYDFERHEDRAQIPFILSGTGETLRFWFWREEEDTGFANISLDYKHAFPTAGHELRVNLQYTRGWEDEVYFLNEISPVRVGTDVTDLAAEENTLPLSIDYVRPLANGRFELGSKVQWRWLPIGYTVERGHKSVIYEGLGDASEWDETIIALYGNLVRIQQAYMLEAGVRVEQTEVAYTIPEENIYYEGSDKYDYLEVFPSVKLSYRLGARNRLIAAYNRRIDRPGEAELRIFPKYDDPELLKVGNPFLRPQLTNVYELGLERSWSKGSVRTSLYQREIDDAFLRIFAIDESNPDYDIINRIYQNAGNSTQTGLEVVLEQQITGRWRVSGSVNFFRNEVDAFETVLLFPTRRPLSFAASQDDTWNLTLNNRIRLRDSGELQLSYIHYAERNVPQGRQRARSSLDLAAVWPLPNRRVELLFTVTDIFNDFAVEQEVDGNGFTALYQNFLETQVATLGLRLKL